MVKSKNDIGAVPELAEQKYDVERMGISEPATELVAVRALTAVSNFHVGPKMVVGGVLA
jgi:hypothetical protein